MSDGKVVATIKASKDYDAPWLVFSGDTPDEVKGLLDQAGPLFAATRTAAAAFSGAPVDQEHATLAGAVAAVPVQHIPKSLDDAIPTPLPGEGAGAYQNRVDAAVSQYNTAIAGGSGIVPPHILTCSQHGKLREFKEGVNKSGKPYAGYFCPERGCAPKWRNRDGGY